MTLYLSSDEKTLDERNTRTKFKNRILPDFFNDNSFNLKLHEIFFDSKFPTLANFEYPHIITTNIATGETSPVITSLTIMTFITR